MILVLCIDGACKKVASDLKFDGGLPGTFVSAITDNWQVMMKNEIPNSSHYSLRKYALLGHVRKAFTTG